jgi:RHS repeat-associated protein
VVEYTYDFVGRPSGISVKAPGAGTFEPVASNIGYLPFGPAEHLEYGPVGTLLTEDRDFDWHYRRTHQTVVDNLSATRLDLDLGYDPAGNLTGITDTVGQRTANYGYDDLGRLISADWSTGAQTRAYDYDDIGNLERIGVNESLSGDGEVLFGYDPNPLTDNSPVLSSVNTYEGVTLTSSHTVVTDTAGNMSDDGQADYDYTLRNHLESRTLGVETSSYTFSADGRRVGMTRGATSLDVVLGLGGRRLSRVLNGATRDYIWLGDTLIGYFDGTATEPVRVLTSHIGFPLMAVDETGTTVWEPMSEPYGELIGTFSKSADPGLRYPGQWQDEVDIEGNCVGDDCTMPGPLGGSASLFENGFRWYRSAWGRYSQSDPIGLQSGDKGVEQLFSYAKDNPLRFIDPLGLIAWACSTVEISVGVGWAGGLFFVECESECVNGKKVFGDYGVGGFGWGLGFAIPAELGTWDLTDGMADPDAENLEGHFAIHGGSVTPFFGFSYTRVEQGLGVGSWGGAPSGGFGVNYFFLSGASKLFDSWEECCDSEGPFIGPR